MLAMATTNPPPGRQPRIPDFDLTLTELRAVTAFNLACAGEVIGPFESVQPADGRPRAALVAAEEFVRGGPRSRAQRIAAPAAHRAAKEVTGAASRAAMAAGDTAASAFLHPLADAAQLGHILRGPAYCVLALQERLDRPLTLDDALDRVRSRATGEVVDVLSRYPRTEPRRTGAGEVMALLDAGLRPLHDQ